MTGLGETQVVLAATALALVGVLVAWMRLRPAPHSQAELDRAEAQAGSTMDVNVGRARLQRWLVESSHRLEGLTWWLILLTAVLAVLTCTLIYFTIRLLRN